MLRAGRGREHLPLARTGRRVLVFRFGGHPDHDDLAEPRPGRAAFGETNFGSLFNNANITVYLGGIKDAKFLGEISQLVGQREIVRGSVNIDGNGRRSVNNSIQKENILDVSDLTEWPVGRALLLASQSRAQIVKTLPWTGNRQWADALTQAKAKAREEQRKAA